MTPTRTEGVADPFEGTVDTGGVSASAVSATWAWLTVGFALVALGAAVVARLFAPAVLLDVIALWPILALGAVVAIPAALLRRRVPVLVVVVPLLVLTWLLAGVAWFLTDGLPPPPSRAADVVGPDLDPAAARLEVDAPGTLRVAATAAADYELAIERTGGDVAPPEVFEATDEASLSAVARARADGGWYESSGWRLGVRPGPAWQLDLQAAEVDADLSTILVSTLAVAADGTVRLGGGGGAVSVLGGTLTLVLPPDTPVTVAGEASVPDSWSATEDGWASPEAGEGYRIEVAAGVLTIVEGDR